MARRWSLRELAARSCLSIGAVQAIESGQAGSVESTVRLAEALSLRVDITIADPRRKPAAAREVDVVHAAMGEVEAAHFRRLGFQVGLDEPYQHYQFAGRADVVIWDVERRALLHIENRTRFPDFQETAGSFNAKRAYLGAAFANRLALGRWESETHVVVALWSAEVLHALRLHR